MRKGFKVIFIAQAENVECIELFGMKNSDLVLFMTSITGLFQKEKSEI